MDEHDGLFVQEPLTQKVQVTQKAIVLKELLHKWSDSTGDRAVVDYDNSNNTFILTQVR